MEEISFTPNPLLEKELHMFPHVQVSVKDAAEAIATRAREMAPVDSGAYAAGIIVNRANTQGGVWRVAATDQKSSWIEFGTFVQAPRFIMRQAVQSLGLHFKKSGS